MARSFLRCCFVTAALLLSAQSAKGQEYRTGVVNPHNTCHGYDTEGRSARQGDSTELWIAGIDLESPAALAGLKNGDRILAMNGNRIRRVPRGTSWMRMTPGDTNVLTVADSIGTRDVRFVIGEWVSLPKDSTVMSYDGSRTSKLCRPPAPDRKRLPGDRYRLGETVLRRS